MAKLKLVFIFFAISVILTACSIDNTRDMTYQCSQAITKIQDINDSTIFLSENSTFTNSNELNNLRSLLNTFIQKYSVKSSPCIETLQYSWATLWSNINELENSINSPEGETNIGFLVYSVMFNEYVNEVLKSYDKR